MKEFNCVVREMEIKYKGRARKMQIVDSPNAIFKFVRGMIAWNTQEKFIVLNLDIKNMVVGWTITGIGTINETLIHPREIFKSAILCNAASIIAVHNHPSGSLVPSGQDIMATERLKKSGEILGIKLLDHVIVTDLGFYSFKEEGMV